MHLNANCRFNPGRRAIAAPIKRSVVRSITTEANTVERSLENHMKETGSIESNINQLQSTKTFVSPKDGMPGPNDGVAESFRSYKRLSKRTDNLGADLAPYYEPHTVLTHPPKPQDITLELLLASQAHMGHSTSLWNPMNQRYIYGIREGIHIISLEETAAHLRRAAKVVEGVAYHGGLILFVGTRPGQDRCVVKAADLAKGCHIFERWIPGTITNGENILPSSSLRIVDEFDNDVQAYQGKIRDLPALKPDLVVCLNPLENYICLHECGLYNIPTIGIIDTDANPTWVTYPIPANDDRYVSMHYLLVDFSLLTLLQFEMCTGHCWCSW